ncbi:hypothetical protein M153_351000127, partial [Pseudoloma neurophilia]
MPKISIIVFKERSDIFCKVKKRKSDKIKLVSSKITQIHFLKK